MSLSAGPRLPEQRPNPLVRLAVVVALIALLHSVAPAGAVPPGDKEVVLPVPLISQQTDSWCWAASAEMIMKYHGKAVPQPDQANQRFGRVDCQLSPPPSDCIQGVLPDFKAHGFDHPDPSKIPLPFAAVAAELKQKRPLGFVLKWTGGGAHMVVIHGFRVTQAAQVLLIQDPLPVGKGDSWILPYGDYRSGPDFQHGLTYYEVKPK